MHLLHIIMKVGRTIPHFEDIPPCDIFDEDSCCCCTDPIPLHVATPSTPKKSPKNTWCPGIDQQQMWRQDLCVRAVHEPWPQSSLSPVKTRSKTRLRIRPVPYFGPFLSLWQVVVRVLCFADLPSFKLQSKQNLETFQETSSRLPGTPTVSCYRTRSNHCLTWIFLP